MKRVVWAVALAAGALSGEASLLVTGTAGAAPIMHHVVVIHGYKFEPRQITITAGDSVTWVNRDADQHTVTRDRGASNSLRSRPLSVGARYSVRFPRAGTFRYHCEFHPFMAGTIRVRSHAAR